MARGGTKLRALDRKVARCVHPHDPQRGGERVHRVGGAGGGEARARGEGGSRYPKVGGEGAPPERYILAMAKRKLSDAFTQWKANFRVIHADRASVRVVTSRMVKRKMFAAFNAWVHATEKRRRERFVVRRALAKLARNLLANSFVAWYEVSSLRRGAEEEEEARRWRENILEVRAVRAPHVTANAEPCVHAVGDGTVAHEDPAPDAQKLRRQTLAQNAVRRVPPLVVDHHRATAPSRVGEARGREDLARRYVVDVFAWQRHIRAKAVWEAKVGLSRRFLASISHQALYRAFHRWREAARKLRALDRKVARCVHRMTRNAVANAFIEWAELVEVKRAREAKEAADTRRWEAKVRRAERYILAMAKRKLSDAFTQWKANFRVIHADRASVRVVTSRMVKRKMFAAFNAWVHATEKRRRERFVVRRALAKLARNLLANSFVAWYEVSSLRRGAEEEEARRWRENILKCERYVHRMSRRTLSRAFTRWETERSRMKTQRQMLRNCVARLSHRMQCAFSSWWSITIERRRHRALVRRAVARISRDAMSSTFFAWQRHIRAKAVWEAKVGLSGGSSPPISHQALYRAFHRWREAARKLRALDRKVARCVHRMTRNAVANAFIEWAELVEAKRAREAKEAADTRRWEAKVAPKERYILAMANAS